MTRLFEMILQTTAGASILVVLVLLLMLALGKRYNQKWRYWVWMFIAIRLVLPFDIPHVASLFTFSIPEEKTVIAYNPENNVGTQNVPDKIIIPSDTTQNIVQNPTQNTQPVIPPTTVTPPSTNDDIIIPIVPNEDVVDVTPVKTISLTQVFAVVWIFGVLGCIAWHIVMHVRFLGRAKLWNRPVAEPWANEIFNNVKKEMGITADVKLYRNRSVHSPILTGFFKPTVLIPTRNLTENDLYMVLRHELLHYKRHDLWYKLLLVAAGCLHWFNPFVWFMVKRADRDLEIACDEAVVKGESTEFRKDYCETILRIIRCDRGRKPALSTGFTTGKKTMKKRFACALDSTAKRTGVILLCLVLCATIVCSTFIACDITKNLTPQEIFDSITQEDIDDAIANPDEFTEEELQYYESILDPYEHSIGVSGEVSWNDPSEIVRKLVKFYEISPGGFAEFFNKVQNKEAEAVKVSGNLMFVPADVVEDHIAKKFNIDKEAFRNEAWRLDEYEYVEQAYAFNTDMGYGGFYDYSILKVEKSGNIWKFYCSNSYPVYYGNEETYEEDYAVIVVEHKGENDYKFLCAKGFHEDKFASVRAKFVYPFSEGIRLCEETDFRFDETVPRENRDKEFASLLCYAARANKGQYQNLSFLISDRDKAIAAISMLGVTTYEEKYSDIWGTLEYRSKLLPFANENIFIPKEWVERAIKQIWGDDVGIEHSNFYAWEYKKDAGIYTPKGTESANIYPYIHSVTKTKNGYVAEVSYLYTGYLGVWGDTEGEARSVDAKDYSDIFATPEVVELAKEQTIYNVTAEYGSDGKLHLKSSVKKRNIIDLPTESTVVGVSDAERYTYLDTIYVTMTNNASEEIEVPSYYCLLKETEYGWVKADFDNAPNTTDTSTIRKSGESWTNKLSLYDSFENLESGYYCLAIGTKTNGNDGVIPLFVSNKFHIDDRVPESKIVAEDRNGESWSAATITWVESGMYKATLYVNGVKKEFNFAHSSIILPDGLRGTLSLNGNIATITADYCGMKMVVDFDRNTFNLSYDISSSDIDQELDISSSGRYTLFYAGFTGAGDAGYSKVVLYDKNDKSYTYICEGGGMYGGGFEAGFLRNEDFYTTSFGELRVYNPKTKELVLDVGKNFKLGYNEEGKFSRYLLTFRRDPNDFSFIVVYFDLPEEYQEIAVNDLLGDRTEYSANYKIGYLDKNGNLLESYDTGMGVWIGRYWTPLEVSMRYSEKALTLIASDGNGFGFTGTFDRTTHEFLTKGVRDILQEANASIEKTGSFIEFAEKNNSVVVSTVEFLEAENYLGHESYALQEGEYELLNTNRMNRFAQNCKSGIADTIVCIKSGSPLPLYAAVLKYDGVSIKMDSYYLKDENLVNITSSETIELFETETMWIFKNKGEVVDVFPSYYGMHPLPFAEKGSMTTDEIAKKLESMSKIDFEVKYAGEETVLETQAYRFDYYDRGDLTEHCIYVSKDLQKIFVVDQAHGRIHTVIK